MTNEASFNFEKIVNSQLDRYIKYYQYDSETIESDFDEEGRSLISQCSDSRSFLFAERSKHTGESPLSSKWSGIKANSHDERRTPENELKVSSESKLSVKVLSNFVSVSQSSEGCINSEDHDFDETRDRANTAFFPQQRGTMGF